MSTVSVPTSSVPTVDVFAGKTVMLFDGVCNFCDATVNFLIDHDPTDRFRFAAQQSDVGQKIMREHGLEHLTLETMVVFDNGQIYTESSAAARVTRYMPMPWKLMSMMVIVPPFLRNWGYKLFAKNRYRLFGQHDACRMPTPAIRAKFL